MPRNQFQNNEEEPSEEEQVMDDILEKFLKGDMSVAEVRHILGYRPIDNVDLLKAADLLIEVENASDPTERYVKKAYHEEVVRQRNILSDIRRERLLHEKDFTATAEALIREREKGGD